jgi:hypothetical protein
MLKIAGKEVILSKSFLIGSNEEAIIAPPELQGIQIRIITIGMASTVATGSDPFIAKMDNGQVTISFPFADVGLLSAEIIYMNMSNSDGKFGCRFAGQSLGGKMMLIHFDLLLDRFSK